MHTNYLEIADITLNTLKSASNSATSREQIILNAGRQTLFNRLKRNSINKLIDEMLIKGIDISDMHPDRAIGVYSEYCSTLLVII